MACWIVWGQKEAQTLGISQVSFQIAHSPSVCLQGLHFIKWIFQQGFKQATVNFYKHWSYTLVFFYFLFFLQANWFSTGPWGDQQEK